MTLSVKKIFLPLSIALFILLTLSLEINSRAQELNCIVKIVNTSKAQLVDKMVFQTLEKDITEFMNNTKWTNDKFQQEEKIECSFLINITQEVSLNYFEATATIQSSRPAYHTNYNSVMLKTVDKNWNFKYTENQPLYYNENAYLSNLTSMLAFYVYIIIGLDYDSFSPKGGTPHYQKAHTVLNNAQNTSEPGWKSHENLRNRYWLIESFQNTSYDPVRDIIYKYHRNGIDAFFSKLEESRKIIMNCLNTLLEIHTQKPNSMIMQLFFNAKSKELISIFKQAPPNDKARATQLLSIMDAANTSEYQKIMER